MVACVEGPGWLCSFHGAASVFLPSCARASSTEIAPLALKKPAPVKVMLHVKICNEDF